MQTLICDIGIDLGAVNTGVFSSNYIVKDVDFEITQLSKNGKTFKVDNKNITFTQTTRRVKRHQKRNIDRRQFAKRLFYLLLDEIGIQKNEQILELVARLLNRRGYTYSNSEIDFSEFEGQEVWENFCSEYLNTKFMSEISTQMLDDLEIIRDQIDLTLFYLFNYEKENENSKFRFNVLFNKLPKPQPKSKDVKDKLLRNINEWYENKRKEEKEGHFYRTEYFKNISDLLGGSEEFSPLRNAINSSKININQFINLICHISNLQDRQLRRYFNYVDKKNIHTGLTKQNEKFDDSRLYETFKYLYDNSHAKLKSEKENKKQLKEFLDSYSKQDKFYLHLANYNQLNATIPPYDDQNNRRPQQCYSLKLNPLALYNYIHSDNTKNIIKIEELRESLKAISNELTDHIAYLEINNDGKQDELFKYANIIQRFFDLTNKQHKKLFNFYLRKNITNALTANTIQSFSEKTNIFLNNLAKDYYENYELSKKGISLVIESQSFLLKSIKNSNCDKELTKSLFYVCGFNCPHKNNELIVAQHLARLLMIDLYSHKEKIDNFIKEFDEIKFKNSGNRVIKLSNFSKNLEELRKKYNNSFAMVLQLFESEEDPSKFKIKDFDKDDIKDITKYIKDIKEATKFVGQYFQLSDEQIKFNNWFSMAQFSTILTGDRSGFSNTCKNCTIENAKRNVLHNNDALFTALPSQAARPFDGVLARLLDKLAYEIAIKKITEIKELRSKNVLEGINSIRLNLYCEQNSFNFETELKRFKIEDPKKPKKVILNVVDIQDKRIISFSKGISAYSGVEISPENCEIDHIIPRSYSLKHFKTIFNSEANLMALSISDNQQKGNSIKTINDLNDNYKNKMFGTSDNKVIENTIMTDLDSIKEDSYTNFSNLTYDQQKALKHGLFFKGINDQIFNKAIGFLSQEIQRAKVNGTQYYFIKKIIEKLNKLASDNLPDINFNYTTNFIDAYNVSLLRKALARKNQQFTKGDKQEDISHAYDAWLTVVGSQNEKAIFNKNKNIVNDEGLIEYISETCFNKDDFETIDISRKKSFERHNFDKIEDVALRIKLEKTSLSSMSLFKDGLIREHFARLFLKEDGILYYGFSLANENHKPYLKEKDNKKNKEKDETIFDDFAKFFKTDNNITAITQNGQLNYNNALNYIKNNNLNALMFSIDKQLAFEFMLNVANNFNRTDKEIKIAEMLNGLCFQSQKKTLHFDSKVIKRLLEAKENGNFDNKTICNIITTSGVESKIGKFDYEESNVIKILDSNFNYNYSSWHNLINFIKEKFKTNNSEINDDFLEAIYREFFKISNNSKFKHHARRKVYSLDALLGGSKKLFRIKRQNLLGNAIYQLHNGNNIGEIGFEFDNKLDIDFNKPILPTTINLSKNVLPIKKGAFNEGLKKESPNSFRKGKSLNITNEIIKQNNIKDLNSEIIDAIKILNYEIAGDSNRWNVYFELDIKKYIESYNHLIKTEKLTEELLYTWCSDKEKFKVKLNNIIEPILEIVNKPQDKFEHVVNPEKNLLALKYRTNSVNNTMKDLFNMALKNETSIHK